MKNRKRTVLLGLLLPYFVFCQEPLKPRLMFSPALNYQNKLWIETNLMLAKIISNHDGQIIWGPRIGVEALFLNEKTIIAPKIGYEWSLMFIVARVNAVSYIENKNIDLRLLPEAGISLVGVVNLTYGYAIPILDYRAENILKHRITLSVNGRFWRYL